MIGGFILPLLIEASAHRIPPAAPLPAPDDNEQAIMQPVNTLLAGMAARDPATVEAQLMTGGSATSVVEHPNGTRTVQRRSWSDLLAGVRGGAEKREERLSDLAVESDGELAMVWGNYVFLIEGKVDHCGVDHFALVRDRGGWKIADFSWSERSTACPPQ